MKEDKAHILRKTLSIITVVLIIATVGLISVASQVKTITLDYYGDKKTIKTLSQTVSGFMLQNKINLSDNVSVYPSADSLITNNMEIKIESNKEYAKFNLEDELKDNATVVASIEEVVEQIPFEEEKVDNSLITRGVVRVSEEGKEGEKVTKYIVKKSGADEILRAEIDSSVTTEPTNRVIEVGTMLNTTVSRSSMIVSSNEIVTDSGFKQYNVALPLEQQKYAYNLCQQYGVQYELFLATMYKESRFNPNAVGGGNSYGLCQIHNSNYTMLANRLGITNFLDPYDNMTAGVYLLSIYLSAARARVSDYSSVEAYALNAYNMGEGVYYNTCFSQGILHREYSNSVRNIRDIIVANGGL